MSATVSDELVQALAALLESWARSQAELTRRPPAHPHNETRATPTKDAARARESDGRTRLES